MNFPHWWPKLLSNRPLILNEVSHVISKNSARLLNQWIEKEDQSKVEQDLLYLKAKLESRHITNETRILLDDWFEL